MTKAELGKVCVFYGGSSNEREISLQSGKNILESLKRQGIDCFSFDPSKQPLIDLLNLKPDRIFMILHGDPGEDGRYQAFFDLHHIPYTGSGMEASVLCLNKLICKTIWQKKSIPTPGYLILDVQEINSQNYYKSVSQNLGDPFVVKPTNEGSSLGITIVNNYSQWQAAIEKTKRYQCSIIAEKFIAGDEITFGVIGNQVLPGILIQTKREFYDFIAKYQDDQTNFICPSNLSEIKEQEYQELAIKAAQVLNCRGWYRVDMIIDQQDNPFVLEINTAPGMTSHSLIPKAAGVLGWSYEQTLLKILENTQFDRVD